MRLFRSVNTREEGFQVVTVEAAGDAPVIENIPEFQIPALTSKDRCDAHASGVAQAYVRVLIDHKDPVNPLYLDFCYHCYHERELELLKYPFRDQRGDLVPGPPGVDH
jgi:hypothetical protein